MSRQRTIGTPRMGVGPKLVPLPATLLACQHLPDVATELGRALGLDPERHRSAGLVTCDQDDALYVALDHATKFAEVDVVFAKSFYAGSKHASGPYSGEIMGILAGGNPDHVAEALWHLREGLADIHFVTLAGAGPEQPAFFPHVITSTGRYLSKEAGIPAGAPMAYLIAPPLEATFAIDAALKAAEVRLLKWLPPPSETNFAGAYLGGELHQLQAAAEAFTRAIAEVALTPLSALRRPERFRR